MASSRDRGRGTVPVESDLALAVDDGADGSGPAVGPAARHFFILLRAQNNIGAIGEESCERLVFF